MSRSVFGKASYIPNQKWVTILKTVALSIYSNHSKRTRLQEPSYFLRGCLLTQFVTQNNILKVSLSTRSSVLIAYMSSNLLPWVFNHHSPDERRWADKNIHKLLRVIVFRAVINLLIERQVSSKPSFIFSPYRLNMGCPDLSVKIVEAPRKLKEGPADQTKSDIQCDNGSCFSFSGTS